MACEITHNNLFASKQIVNVQILPSGDVKTNMNLQVPVPYIYTYIYILKSCMAVPAEGLAVTKLTTVFGSCSCCWWIHETSHPPDNIIIYNGWWDLSKSRSTWSIMTIFIPLEKPPSDPDKTDVWNQDSALLLSYLLAQTFIGNDTAYTTQSYIELYDVFKHHKLLMRCFILF